MIKMGLEQMLGSVRQYLSQFGLIDERIIDAMRRVDRRNFVLERDKDAAFLDEALPINSEQTISQPSTVARMIQLLELHPNDSVLEIGTGSGWNAALIGTIANQGEVLSLEVVGELVFSAVRNLKEAGMTNVIVSQNDFRLVVEKFNKIIFTAGILPESEEVIERFAEKNLKEGGILICPFSSGPMIIIKKLEGKVHKTYTDEEYVFVPLVL